MGDDKISEENDSNETFNDEIMKLLKDIWNIRKALLECPKESYGPGFISLPPSQMTYWCNVENLEDKLDKLNQITTGEIASTVSLELDHFKITKYKECSIVKDFKFTNKERLSKQYNKLSSLMIKANKQILIDLYGLFSIIEDLKL